MPRRTASSTDGLRELLISDMRRSLARWGIPGKRDEFLEALRAGDPVVVSSAALLKAFSLAGLPHREFCFGGRHWKAAFLLDEHDQLHEVDV